MLISGNTGIVRKFFVILLSTGLLMVGACGGGGSSGGAPSASEPPASAKDGAFTLSTHSADFKAVSGTTPASQSVTMNITGPNVSYVGTGYVTGQPSAGWVNTDIQGSGASLTLVVSVSTSGLTAGTYTNTFTVATADASKNLLQTQTFTVTLTVLGPISISVGARPQPFIIGDARTTDVYKLTVNSNGRPWKLSSDQPWLKVPAGTQTINGTIDLQIDAGGLAAGPQIANITVSSDDAFPEQIPQSISIDVIMPQLVISTDAMAFGGTDGLGSLAPAALSFHLSAGQSTHSFTLTTTTSNTIPWLKTDVRSGSVGTNDQAVHVSIDRQSLRGGTYTGSVAVSVNVGGTIVTKSLPVTLNIEARRIVVTADGVGFSSVTGLPPVLNRAVKVVSTIPNVSSSWAAKSDSAWLSVTSNGLTGDDVVLTADPTGLPTGSTSYALVTITSGDPLVENQQTIRVGLYVGNQFRDGAVNSVAYNDVNASPVDPVFAASTDTGVDIINAYTGDLLKTFTGNVVTPGKLIFSSDGRYLFVADSTSLKVVQLDAETGAKIKSFDLAYWDGSRQLGYVRPGGFPMLFATGNINSTSGHAYDVTTGEDMFATSQNHVTGIYTYITNTDQTLLTDEGGAVYKISRSALSARKFVYTFTTSAGTAQGRTGEACFSADGSKIYTASGAPYNFPATDLNTGTVVQVLPGVAYPNSIKCLWNGKVIGGADAYYEQYDIFVYDGPTATPLGKLTSAPGIGYVGYRELMDRGLAVSGDGNRLASRDGSLFKGLLYVQSIP